MVLQNLLERNYKKGLTDENYESEILRLEEKANKSFARNVQKWDKLLLRISRELKQFQIEDIPFYHMPFNWSFNCVLHPRSQLDSNFVGLHIQISNIENVFLTLGVYEENRDHLLSQRETSYETDRNIIYKIVTDEFSGFTDISREDDLFKEVSSYSIPNHHKPKMYNAFFIKIMRLPSKIL